MLLNESVLLIVGPFIGLAKTGMIERTQKLANTPASIAGEVLHKVFLSNFSSTQSTEETIIHANHYQDRSGCTSIYILAVFAQRLYYSLGL